jgi:hypothetical protein
MLRLTTLLACTCCMYGQAKYRNTSLTPEARATDLVSQMTLEEKVGQMMNAAPLFPGWAFPPMTGGTKCSMGLRARGSLLFSRRQSDSLRLGIRTYITA